MKRAINYLVGFLFLGSLVFSQEASGLKPATTVLLQDEGVNQGRIKTLNCTGSGVSCSASGIVGTLNSSGGGGGGNFLAATITITDNVVGLIYTVTITGQAWVGASSIIICSPFAIANGGTTLEMGLTSGINVITSNRVAGVGFDLSIYNPHGAQGTFTFHCTGA